MSKARMFLVKRADRALDVSGSLAKTGWLHPGDVVLEVPSRLSIHVGGDGLDAYIDRMDALAVCNMRDTQGTMFVPREDLQEITTTQEQYVVLTLTIPARRLADLLKSLG